ncbi:MAG: DHH family phosphoesterase [Oscillospiraceae bacterium]|nr:DHH family phosphoesterase [Oscillospiraceae bacterium]
MAVYFVISACFCLTPIFMGYPIVAGVEALVLVILFIWYQIRNAHRKRELSQYLQDVNFSLDAVSSEQMNIPLPAVILNLRDGEISWSNDAFLRIAGEPDSVFETPITDYFPDFSFKWLLEGHTECPDEVFCGSSRYRVYGDTIRSNDETTSYQIAMLYFIDLTDLLDLREEYTLSRPVVSLILVDNYDELTANLSDKSISNFSAKLDDAITSWVAGSGGILRRLERNRYLFLFESRELPRLIDEKFSILETVRAITNDYGAPATLSIGIGKDGQTLQECYDFASLSIDMSLSRGGDQAVIKDRYNFSFYGGRAKEAERRTLVKSRVMAGSLQELISQSSMVFIMGHRNADLDAVGSAVGVMAICRKVQVPAKIVLDQKFNAASALLEKLMAVPAYQDAFISPGEAIFSSTPDSLLVVVDTNRPDQVESRPLLDTCSRVAVIDHHRRAADYIDDALLNFHEPYASSASELVTELIQYLLDREDLLPVEALSLLAGIVLDTKNFSVRTGTRTFEAAAWLRKNGADTVAVKLLFQNDLKATLSRYEIIQHAELYRDNIALCCLNYTSDRITAAQAADELLNISGIQASFVFYPDGNQVICSARSIGEANVQMILEPLGGGGNQATAGAQIRGLTPEQVRDAIKQSIDEFFAE